MPLMREWIEITVDEDLLSSVVRELLDMATDPNHVDVINGPVGRVILAEAHLAHHWYQERLKLQEDKKTELPAVNPETVVVPKEEVVVPLTVVAPAPVFDMSDTARSSNAKGTEDLVPLPVKRGPGRPRNALSPSASPDGEES